MFHRNLQAKFEEMLREAGTLTGSPLVVFIDGLDMMEPAYMPHTLDWLPESLPKVKIYQNCLQIYNRIINKISQLSEVNYSEDTF